MGTALTILFYVIIAVTAFLASQSVFVLINFFSFNKPFAQELKRKGLAKPGLEQAVNKGSLIRGLVICAAGTAVSLALASQTFPGGMLVFAIVLLFGLVIFKPVRPMYTRSNYNISCFVNKYKDYVNLAGFKKTYAQELSDVEPILQKK